MPRRKPASSRPDPATAALLQTLNPPAAGIDSGATEFWVCVSPNAVASPSVPSAPAVVAPHVRRFGSCTADLDAMAAWLRQCQGTTVALASTGVYWIPLSDVRESAGVRVRLVDPRQVQRAPNRPKTDVHDCQGIQRLHSLGLLTAAVRPEEPIRVWRAYQRHRATLSEDAGRHLQRLEKALEQMHVTLPDVVSDLAGLTGMRMVRAIVQGERDPKALATLRDHRGKERAETIARALHRGRGSPSTCAPSSSPWRWTMTPTSRSGMVTGSSRRPCRGWRCQRCHRWHRDGGSAAARRTRGPSTHGNGCTTWPGET